MITRLQIQNFKSLKRVDIALKPFNLLVGINGMGKSSFLQAILLLIQSEKLDQGEIDLNGNLVEIGQGKDALYQFAEEDLLSFGLTLNDDHNYSWVFGYSPMRDKLTSIDPGIKMDLKEFHRLVDSFQYISADRIGPKDLYDSSTVMVEDRLQIGLLGEYAVNFINTYGTQFEVEEALLHPGSKSPFLLDQVGAWLNEVSPGVSLNTRHVPEVNKFILDYQFEFSEMKTNRFKPKNVGFGLSYVLPVVVALLTSKPGKTIIIENPESHIHPRGQVELGKLMALATKSGVQLFVETHSDHIINGTRVAIKEELIDPSNVKILYFSKESSASEQFTILTDIKVDHNGELSEYPANFLDEWANQLLKLL